VQKLKESTKKRKSPVAVPEIDIELICNSLLDGKTITAISHDLKITRSALERHISTNEGDSARVRDARCQAASFWDEAAEKLLSDAKDPFELSRARELAQHYRWRASKIAPREYGNIKDSESDGNLTIRVINSPDEL
jgi:hypothetical protein